MPLHEIKNFHQVDARVGTGGQPTAPQLHEVAQEGYQVVVNLGLLDPRYCLADEAGLVARLGMEYHHIPVKFEEPRMADLRAFVELMDANATKRTFVHCAANFRVSSFVALYGQLRLGWSAEAASALVGRFWQPNETWQKFLTEGRRDLLVRYEPER
jgi:protein tyrosine phosphatase (PTP) superfamily phosphohydrolase (DUF442 family)